MSTAAIAAERSLQPPWQQAASSSDAAVDVSAEERFLAAEPDAMAVESTDDADEAAADDSPDRAAVTPARSTAAETAAVDAAAAAAAAGCPGRRQSVLLVHEHHLKPIGSDLRLLGVLMQLRGLGHTVSLLFRGPVPPEQRSPPTHELAALIGASETDAFKLGGGGTDERGELLRPLRPPPAIYEYSDLASIASLARHGWFDLVMCSFWFWRDPAPSTAELLLPTLQMHSPRRRRPWLAILSDDAHSAKAAMMAEWERDAERKALWQGKAESYPARQRGVYSLADAVVHISDADGALERRQFNASCRAWHTLRMSPRGFGMTAASLANATTDTPESAAAQAAAAAAAGGDDDANGDGGGGGGGAGGGGGGGGAPGDGEGLSIGFMGNGATPTNHLSIQWFLEAVWPALLERKPELRMRLVGYPPDDRPKKVQARDGPCELKGSPVRCGWAWGTVYAGSEEAGGIDALGFLSDSEMLSEMRSWRAMVVPILRTTGVNTKLLPALQWSTPLVLTSVAASPLGIPFDGSVALVADDAATFVSHLTALLDEPALQARLAAASGAHWRRLLAEDAGATDLLPILAASCAAAALPDGGAVARAPPRPATPPKQRLVADLGGARRPAPLSRCFGGGGGGAGADEGPAPALYVAMHGGSANEASALLMHQLWAVYCGHCGLRCAFGRGSARGARRGWDVLVEHESTDAPEQFAAALRAASASLAPRPLRLLHLPSAPLAAALKLSERGDTFGSLVQSELARGQLREAMEAHGVPNATWHEMLLEPLNRNNSHFTFLAGWRETLGLLGVAAPDDERLVARAAEMRTRFASLDAAPQWLGCYRDAPGDRAFNDGPRAFGHTSQSCAAACTGYRYFALQGGGQCFCGREPPHGNANHTKLADSKCGHVCASEEGKEPARYCGAGWRNAVYGASHAAQHELDSSPPISHPKPAAAAAAGSATAGGAKPAASAKAATKPAAKPTTKSAAKPTAKSRSQRKARSKSASGAHHATAKGASGGLSRGVGTLRH